MGPKAATSASTGTSRTTRSIRAGSRGGHCGAPPPTRRLTSLRVGGQGLTVTGVTVNLRERELLGRVSSNPLSTTHVTRQPVVAQLASPSVPVGHPPATTP